MNDDVRAMLTKLAADPATTAAVYGRRTGSCCFCGRHLDDARSIAMGYGPVCAKKFGVARGEDRAETAAVKATVERVEEYDIRDLRERAAAGASICPKSIP